MRENSNNSERETGFEPATSTLARWHSTAELLPQTARESLTCTFRQCQASRPRARPRHFASGRAGRTDASATLLHLVVPTMELKSFSGAAEQSGPRDVVTPRLTRRRARLQNCLIGGSSTRASARHARRAQ